MEECKTNSIVKGENGFDYIVLLDEPEKGRIWVRPKYNFFSNKVTCLPRDSVRPVTE